MIKIIVPFYQECEYVKPSLRALRESGLPFEGCFMQGPLIMNNRNRGVTASQKIHQQLDPKYSHYLFADSDIAFTPEHVRIALSHSKPIVAMPYLRHENDGLYQAGDFADLERASLNRMHCATAGFLEVDFVGAGFLLVERGALESMRFPWFRHDVVEVGDEADNRGEDVCFCIGAFEAGYSIWCDFDHPVTHRLRTATDFSAEIT